MRKGVLPVLPGFYEARRGPVLLRRVLPWARPQERNHMKIRDRIKRITRVKASELTPNPKNWRTHPTAQADALKGVLAEVGNCTAVIARELPDGSLMLLDGHLRAETLGDEMVQVIVLDVDEAEGDKILATLDPLAALAETNAANLDALLRSVDTGNEALSQMLADLADKAGLYQSETKDAPEEFPEVDENIETEHECPKCGYRWS